MDETLWACMKEAGTDPAGLPRIARFGKGKTLPLMFGLSVLSNLLIPPLTVYRLLRRAVTVREDRP